MIAKIRYSEGFENEVQSLQRKMSKRNNLIRKLRKEIRKQQEIIENFKTL